MAHPTSITTTLAPSLPASFFNSIGVSANAGHPSFLVFSLHRCASTMLQRAFNAIGEHNGMPNVSMDSWRFDNGHHYTGDNLRDLPNLFLPTGYWYGVFRQYRIETTALAPFDRSWKSILLVRDPRDILTSLYFSRRYSHAAPGNPERRMQEIDPVGGDTIDHFVLSRADAYLKRFTDYIGHLLPAGRTKVFRYEDVIMDKARLFLPAMAHLGLEYPPRELEALCERETVIPDAEDIHAHIRQVRPGDHREKLAPATISRLNHTFRKVLDYFGYSD